MGLLFMFNFYRVIGGIGVGLASAVSPMYIGEIAPADIRGRLVSINQFDISQADINEKIPSLRQVWMGANF